jgi:hypothetical protein
MNPEPDFVFLNNWTLGRCGTGIKTKDIFKKCCWKKNVSITAPV